VSRRLNASQQFYSTLSPRSRVMLDATIFCLFAPIGLAADLPSVGTMHWVSVTLMVLMSGTIAVLFGRSGFTGRFGLYMTLGLTVQVGIIVLIKYLSLDPKVPLTLDADGVAAARTRLRIDTMLLVGFIVAGYSLFLALWNREGSKYFSRGTEIKLAQRMHDRLVPPISGRGDGIEWAGFSRPSGEIGGDLVDAIEGPAGMVGCVADVSGHGVGAGLLMGMFKTAFRAAAEETSEPSLILARAHVTLSPLTEPNMYITAAVARVEGRQLHVAGGGHPPMLLYRRATGTIEQIDSTGPAIALLDDFSCRTISVPFHAGDIALLVTDGITEALDGRDTEVGTEQVGRVLAAHATAPLDTLLARISELAGAVTRVDDQTLLVIRAT
jgi:hypothetical protein